VSAFEITPRKPYVPLSAAERAAATAKAKATRIARGTTSKKQKAAVSGAGLVVGSRCQGGEGVDGQADEDTDYRPDDHLVPDGGAASGSGAGGVARSMCTGCAGALALRCRAQSRNGAGAPSAHWPRPRPRGRTRWAAPGRSTGRASSRCESRDACVQHRVRRA
jgi:hypothetical protein